MIIACPRCATSYAVRAELFGGQQRPVQCSACGCRWLQPPDQSAKEGELESVAAVRAAAGALLAREGREEPEWWLPRDDSPVGVPAQPAQEPDRAGDEPPSAPEEETPDAAQPEAARPAAFATPPPQGTADAPGADAPGANAPGADAPGADAPGAVEAGAAAAAGPDHEATGGTKAGASRRPTAGRTAAAPAHGIGARAVEILRRPSITAATAAVATLFTLSALLIVLRAQIISALPSAAGVYGVVGLAPDPLGAGLEIREIEIARELQGGEAVLRVMGVVANVADRPQPLPSIRVSLFDDDDEELQFTTLAHEHNHLSPGDALSFDARIIEPRPEARRVRVGFVAGGP